MRSLLPALRITWHWVRLPHSCFAFARVFCTRFVDRAIFLSHTHFTVPQHTVSPTFFLPPAPLEQLRCTRCSAYSPAAHVSILLAGGVTLCLLRTLTRTKGFMVPTCVLTFVTGLPTFIAYLFWCGRISRAVLTLFTTSSRLQLLLFSPLILRTSAHTDTARVAAHTFTLPLPHRSKYTHYLAWFSACSPSARYTSRGLDFPRSAVTPPIAVLRFLRLKGPFVGHHLRAISVTFTFAAAFLPHSRSRRCHAPRTLPLRATFTVPATDFERDAGFTFTWITGLPHAICYTFSCGALAPGYSGHIYVRYFSLKCVNKFLLTFPRFHYCLLARFYQHFISCCLVLRCTRCWFRTVVLFAFSRCACVKSHCLPHFVAFITCTCGYSFVE